MKSVLVRLDELFIRIEKDYNQQQYEKIHEPISIKMYEDWQTSVKEYENFLHFQMLIDCLIRMKPMPNEKNQLVDFCKEYYKNNYTELKIINEFENAYSSKDALRWYTRPSFLSRLLNRAFRDQNVDLLLLFRFFIHDVIRELGKDMPSSSLRAYRGQLMSKEEFHVLECSAGKYLSVNSFLPANIDPKRTRSFLLTHNASDNVVKAFFEIEANPRLCSIRPFNNIQSRSFFPRGNEILFTVGSIFQIRKIEYPDDQICNIRMKLWSIDDQDLVPLFKHIKQELGTEKTTLMQYGNILRRMDKLTDAEKYYRRYLNNLPDNHPELADCYHELGKTAELKKNFNLSLKWYISALDICLSTTDTNERHIATLYSEIGSAYSKTKDYENAIESYENALKIWGKLGDDQQPCVAKCFSRLGFVYQMQKKYQEALSYFQQSYKILKGLYKNQPETAAALKNIAQIHELLGQFKEALAAYDDALKIYRQSLPSTQIYVNEIEKRKRRISSK